MSNVRQLANAVAALALLLISAPAARSGETAPSDPVVSARLASYLDATAAEGFTGVALVARGGTVLLERGYGRRNPGGGDPDPVRSDTVFSIGSITKQFTAAAILKLEEMDRLRVEDPIGRWLAGVPEDKRPITIHHLLTHQAGFPGAIGDDFERIGRDAFVRLALATPLVAAPGAKYEYSNVGFSLAAAIVELASGEPYETFLRRHLLEPAGLRDTGYHLAGLDARRLAHGVRDDGGDWGTPVEREFSDGGPGWHLLGNGGLLSTAGDMLRWHRALAGDSLLSPASKAKLYARHVEEGGGTWYGYGWSIEPTEWGEAITHNGGNPFFFADLLRFPDSDLVVFVATSSRDRRMRRLARPLASIAFTGAAPPLEPPKPALAQPGSSPAPAGTAAARWGLPGTAAGRSAARLLDALAAGDSGARRRFAAEGFAPAVVARRGAEGLLALLERMRGDLGEFRLAGFAVEEQGALLVVLAPGGKPGPMQIRLEVEPAEPHRIAGVGVTLGD